MFSFRSLVRRAHITPTLSVPTPTAPTVAATVAVAAALMLSASACGGPADDAEDAAALADAPAATAQDLADAAGLLTPELAAEVEALGDPASRALAQGLVSQLSATMEAEGVAAAVDFCASEALVLTAEIQDAYNPDFAFKRATLQWRNPANGPDAYEERILRYLEAMEFEAPGSAPETLSAMGPDGTVRFYRVLRTAPMCLQCHGSEDAMDAEVRRIIAERYPDDRATGYEAGDFRGVIRIQIPGVQGP
jgi:hypothetical protein